MSKETEKRKKPGPEAERLKIDRPEKALQKLLRTPPRSSEDEDERELPDDADASSQPA